MLDADYQQLAMNSIAHAAEMIREDFRYLTAKQELPSVLYRPKLFIDGNQWCALYGENIQDGVAGFGDSPEEAMHQFNAAWVERIKK